ncbi:MAG: hypothetical protein EAX96_13000 [Candidatus Lokiarchaeota archaeon]|nr:hypothetical protein [Candidatus Lokiarchaeota archaeon]
MVRNGSDPMNEDEDIESFKNMKDKIKEELKKEILEEIYNELKAEELQEEPIPELIPEHKEIAVPAEPIEIKEKISITIKAVLKIASHALKYANKNIPKSDWVEVIGLLAGKTKGSNLIIDDAYPMGHGTAIYAEIKDYRNFTRAFNDIRSKNLFICGWYHSHPSYGLFMSNEDFGTQVRYQKLWDRSIALVIDPYKIDGKTLGFDIFRANLSTKKWFSLPFIVEGLIEPAALPHLLEFINPIIDGKAVYLEYDED